MNVLVKYPTRSRPELFRRVLQQYLADPTVRVLVSADNCDDTMNTPEMVGWLRSLDRVKVRYGCSKTKIEAVNDGLDRYPWDGICILASDDMIPQCPDYACRIVELFEHHFPNGDGVLHLDDGRTGNRLNTLCIADRKYFDRFGYLYHPDYCSLWCDNEWQEVSESLGRAVYVPEVIIKHEWIGVTGADALHQHNERYHRIDEQTYRRRKAAGFPKHSVL